MLTKKCVLSSKGSISYDSTLRDVYDFVKDFISLNSDLPERRDLSKMHSDSQVQASTLALLQETVVKWLASFTHATRKTDQSVHK